MVTRFRAVAIGFLRVFWLKGEMYRIKGTGRSLGRITPEAGGPVYEINGDETTIPQQYNSAPNRMTLYSENVVFDNGRR